MTPLTESSWGLEKIWQSTINKGGYPGPICAGFYQTNTFNTKTKREKNLIEKGNLNSIKGIFHTKIDDHAFLLPPKAGMEGFLHLYHIIYRMFAFNKPPLERRN